ncbi:endochitinase A isoform X2 [Myripristis murdjan]|uniref:endochitinase A isoform X2 n=1 Tax=Myripristis murdjan TaxID=586833 RepID=UPI0011763058|nr:armadillo-like helical domain-containing protein 4 isoform X2 [Myripristis murdjan]
MLMSGTLHRLLLAGTCLCVYSTPIRLQVQNNTPTQDSNCGGQCGSTHTTGINSKSSDTDKSAFGTSEHVTGLIVNVGAEGGAGPDGQKTGPEGIVPVTQAGNGDSHGGRSGPSEADEEAWSERSEGKSEPAVGSSSEMGEAQRQTKAASVLSAASESEPAAAEDTKEDAPVISEAVLSPAGERQQLAVAVNTPRPAVYGFSASSVVPPQLETYSLRVTTWERKGLDQGRQRNGPWSEAYDKATLASFGAPPQGKETGRSRPSSTQLPHPSAWFQRLTSHSISLLSPISPSSFLSPRTATPLSVWGQEGVTASTLPDPLLPDIGPNLTPKEDGPENLWTEAVRQNGADTVLPLSQDEATEGTMSSEALPLIFEPFDDATPESAAAVVTLAPGSSQPLAAMATRGMLLSEADLNQLVTVETDSDGPSRTPPLLLPDWTSPWQTSGAELLEPISPSGLSVSPPPAETEPGLLEDRSEKAPDRIPNLEAALPTTGPSVSSIQRSVTTVTKATHRLVSKSRSGLEEMESEEEPDEDEEDENTEESEEEDSEEDLTETPKTASTRPPYSLIPPPPVWVQRNQGLMRSWVELIREKAGYVSGMLAPVGIGITGALLIVGALYSIRMIHRKRRNSFKHQRRKQPREPGTSRQDQAMLLADSSEDEF